MKVVSRVSRNHFLEALRGIAVLLVLVTNLQSALVGFYPAGWLAAHPIAITVLPCWSTERSA